MLPQHLWERDRQLDTAAERLGRARGGRGGTVFLLGEGGIGKTALLDEVSRLAGSDVLVARARCDPMEATLTFGLLSQVVHALGGTDDEMWTEPAAHGGADARSATLYRSLRWLQDAAPGPVLVTVDDLQWADPDSLAWLGFLCRRLAALPVLVVASLRGWPPEAADLAHGLSHRGGATLERLLPLSEQAAAGVLAERHGASSAGVASRAWQASGGNPLLLGLAARSLLSDETGTLQADGFSVSLDERSLVLGRFAGPSAAETRWARAAAVLGVAFRSELVSELAGLDPDQGEAAAEGLWRSGLVRSSANGTAEFVHPVFAQLLYDDLPALTRTRLHARAFTALRASGMEDIAAEHAVRGDLVGNAAAVEVLTSAGRRAFQAGAGLTAVSRLEAAVRLSGDAPAGSLLADLGRALQEAGRLTEAVATISYVLQTDLVPRARVEALTTLSRAHFSTGDFDRAGAALETAAALAEHACPDAVVLPLCQHANAVLMTAGPAAAVTIAERARALAAGGGPRRQAQAGALWGLLAYWCGDASGLDAAQSAGRHLLGGTPAEIDEDVRSGGADVLNPYAGVAALAGHLEEAESAFTSGIAAAERVGAVTAGAALRIGYGAMLLRTRVGDSLAVIDELLAVTDLVPLAEPFARAMRSHALLELGEEAQSLAEQERAEVIATPFGLWLCVIRLQHVQGLRLLRSGRHADASTVYCGLEEQERQLGVGEPCTVSYARHAVVAHVRSGRIREAELSLARLDEQAGRLPCRWPRAAAAASRALLALHHGDRLEADTLYRAAIEILDDTSLPLELAEVLLDHGTMLRHGGRPREARESFRRAAEVAQSVGAVWLAQRADEELAAAGGRRRARRPTQELTPQEERIAHLASTGASDKDIAAHLAVSVRTVRTHLEHVYSKLGIHSRRELMLRG